MRRWTRWLAASVLIAVFLVVTGGPGIKEQRLSCHKCRNLKYVTTRNFLFIHGTPVEREEQAFPIPEGHVHDWWQCGSFKSQGIGGWLGESVACQPNRYKDAVEMHMDDHQ